jgi:hypothetical protein
MASSQRDFESLVGGAIAPPSDSTASSPLSSPIKSAARPLSSHQPSRPQPIEALESPVYKEATADIEMELPDMDTGMDMDGLIDEPTDPEDFLSFEPFSPQDEVPTAK